MSKILCMSLRRGTCVQSFENVILSEVKDLFLYPKRVKAMSKISQSYHDKTPLFKGLELEIGDRRVRFRTSRFVPEFV
jgi:hypothetical protein